MTNQLPEQRRLSQTEFREFLHKRLGLEPWVTVAALSRESNPNQALFCALIPLDIAEKVISHTSWDIRFDSGRPWFEERFAEGQEPTVTYLRYGNTLGIEPFVYLRSFHDIKQSYFEVSEEFRLFHNLYHDVRINEFVQIDESGESIPAVRIKENRVDVSLKPLKQFLAAKQMHLLIYFDSRYFSQSTLSDLGLAETENQVRIEGLAYDLVLRNAETATDRYNSFSLLMGKKLLTVPPRPKSGNPRYKEQGKFCEFIIGVDADGQEINFTCDPEKLYAPGKFPAAPDFLTQVFFRRTVLTKYYSNPSIYSVEDSCVRCGSLWILNIDNNHPDYVIVWLGDLASMPYNEQLYWTSSNVVPDGRISNVALRRQIYAEFIGPRSPDLVFKSKFELFAEEWNAKYSWDLFLPLSQPDRHYYDALHIPLADEQKEFDEQVFALSKILIDSLNELELAKRIPSPSPDEKEIKGITKLERFLQSSGVAKYQIHIKFLRDLYALRSTGVAHRKGKKFNKIAEAFGIPDKGLITGFSDILTQTQKLLEFLEQTFSLIPDSGVEGKP